MGGIKFTLIKKIKLLRDQRPWRYLHLDEDREFNLDFEIFYFVLLFVCIIVLQIQYDIIILYFFLRHLGVRF